MAYLFLALAIAAEVAGTSLIKSTEGFSRLWPSLCCLGAYGVSFFFLSHAVRDVPVGVAYALWSGLGTVAIVTIGAVFLGESVTFAKAVGVGLVVSGVVVLNLGGTH
jgi:small multidrug resistance pump